MLLKDSPLETYYEYMSSRQRVSLTTDTVWYKLTYNAKEVQRILNRCLFWTYNVLVRNSIIIADDAIVNKTVTVNCGLGSVAEAQNFPCNMGSLKWKPLTITGILTALASSATEPWFLQCRFPLLIMSVCGLCSFIHSSVHGATTQEPAGFPPRRPGFKPGAGHMWFMADKVALGRFPPSTSVSPVNLHSTTCSTITIFYNLGLVQ
jgi:hypothetical protein